MKSIFKACLFAAFLFASAKNNAQSSGAQKDPGKGADKEQHIPIDQFPKNMVMNHLNGWGGMTVAVNEMPAGTDLAPLLKGLKNNSCQVPHWGYIIKGSLRIKYDDGKEVVLKAGDLFYMPSGHTGIIEEDMKLMDFSPENEMKELIKHVEKKVAELKQQ